MLKASITDIQRHTGNPSVPVDITMVIPVDVTMSRSVTMVIPVGVTMSKHFTMVIPMEMSER